MVSMTIPDAMKHLVLGSSRVGPTRRAHGLMLRAMVTAVYKRNDPQWRGSGFQSEALPGIVCDVRVLDPGYGFPLYNVPIMTKSAGLNDYEQWEPRPASVNLGTGPFSPSPEAGTGPATSGHDHDGDIVLIGFMANDLNKPVILGQLPNPRTNRAPEHNDAVKWRRYLRGSFVSVGDDGNIEIDTTSANDGTILPSGTEAPAAPGAAGNITVTQATAQKVQILNSTLSAPEAALRGDTFLADLQAALLELQAFANGFGVPTPNCIALQTQITASLGAGAPYLSRHLEID